MYPLLKWDVILVRQYKEPYIYFLNHKENGLITSSHFEYEVINQSASELLELCDGSKSIDVISSELASHYQRDVGYIKPIVQDFLDDSVGRGYIEYRNNPHKEPIKVFGNNKSYTPMHAEIEITKQCPLKCMHCYNNSGIRRPDELPTEEIINVLKKLKHAGVIKIAITGGEPTSKAGFSEICNYASENFMAVAVMSNGYCINDSLIKKIENCKANTTFQISIDGNLEHHNAIRGRDDAYQRACESIKLLRKYGFNVAIASTFNEKNVDDMDEITQVVKKLGAMQITYGLTMNIGRASKNCLKILGLGDFYERVLEMKKRYSEPGFFVNVSETVGETDAPTNNKNCGLAYKQITVRENGEVSPCVCFFYSIGNLKEQNLEDILTYEVGDLMSNLSSPNKEVCNDCIKSDQCTQCIALAYDSALTKNGCRWRYENLSIINELSKKMKPLQY